MNYFVQITLEFGHTSVILWWESILKKNDSTMNETSRCEWFTLKENYRLFSKFLWTPLSFQRFTVTLIMNGTVDSQVHYCNQISLSNWNNGVNWANWVNTRRDQTVSLRVLNFGKTWFLRVLPELTLFNGGCLVNGVHSSSSHRVGKHLVLTSA